MYMRYRYFVYFLGALILGSILLDWLTGSVRVSAPPRIEGAPTVASPPGEIATPPTGRQGPADTGAGSTPTYAPSYENPSVSDRESAAARGASSSDQQTPTGIANSSDLQPPAPPPTASSEGPASPDRDQTTASPKSSNAALREALKSKGR